MKILAKVVVWSRLHGLSTPNSFDIHKLTICKYLLYIEIKWI